jgi:hypothetical protein
VGGDRSGSTRSGRTVLPANVCLLGEMRSSRGIWWRQCAVGACLALPTVVTEANDTCDTWGDGRRYGHSRAADAFWGRCGRGHNLSLAMEVTAGRPLTTHKVFLGPVSSHYLARSGHYVTRQLPRPRPQPNSTASPMARTGPTTRHNNGGRIKAISSALSRPSTNIRGYHLRR